MKTEIQIIRGSRWQVRTYSLVSKDPERPDFRMICHTVKQVYSEIITMFRIFAPPCRERLLQHSILKPCAAVLPIVLSSKCRGKYTQTGWDQYTEVAFSLVANG